MSQAVPVHSNNVEEELQRVQQALQAVFCPPATTTSSPAQEEWWQQRSLADRYLTSFQSQSVAWMVCDRLLLLLQSNASSTALQSQSYFFAAQTLYTKCQAGHVSQLPQDSLSSLRDSLIGHLTTAQANNANNHALITRLAMAIAALGVQMKWYSMVSDLLQQTHSHKIHPAAVLLILRALPEECANDRLILLDETVRYHMRDALVEAAFHWMDFLYQSLQQASTLQEETILEAWFVWIRYVPILPQVLQQTPLLEYTFQLFLQPQRPQALREVAGDALIEILRMYPSHSTANQTLVSTMIPKILHLISHVVSASSEDAMRLQCRLVTEMGESYMAWILSRDALQTNTTPSPLTLVDWVLQCSALPVPEIANITLHFWYRLVVELEETEPYEWRQELIDVYSTRFLQLLDTCCSHLLLYPTDLDHDDEEALDDFHRDRFYVSETVEDCCRLLGGQVVLQRIVGRLQQIATSSSTWQAVEACFMCIQCIHRFIPKDEADYLPFVFGLVPQLPTTILQQEPLQYTICQTIGKYASWLAAHSALLQPLLPYLAQGLRETHCAPAAAVAIKELCTCPELASMGDAVLQLYQELQGSLALREELEILEGVCRTQPAVDRLVQPIGTRLANCVQDPSLQVNLVIPEVERLTVVIRCVPQKAVVLSILQAVWDWLDQACQRFPNSNPLAEKVCRLHKHALRTCGAQTYAPLLERLAGQLVRGFEQSHQSPYLYAASICVTEYGRDPNYVGRLMELMQALCTTAFGFLQTLDDLTQHPDVVEELFFCMGRVLSYCPSGLVSSPLMDSLVPCALVGMQLDHPDAHKGTLNFLEQFVSYGVTLRQSPPGVLTQAVERIVTQHGSTLVTNLVRALQGDLPAHCLDRGHGSIAGILWNLNALCPTLLEPWMAAALSSAPEPAKTDFLGAFGQQRRTDFDASVRVFRSACLRARKIPQT